MKIKNETIVHPESRILPADYDAGPKHKCRCIARNELGRESDWLIGELIDPDEHAGKTHCLHLRRVKSQTVLFLDKSDLEAMMILVNAGVGLQNIEWLEVNTRAARYRAGETAPPESADTAKKFAEETKSEEAANSQ